MFILRGILGLAFLTGIAWLLSSDRKKINWVTVGSALGLQLVLAMAVMHIGFVETGFDWISQKVVTVIEFTDQGSAFLFRSFTDGKVDSGLENFAFKVLPTIVFFSALSALLYYLGILQKIVYVFAWIMKHTMRLSGAESLAAAGNVFLGQTESPFLVKPFLKSMTRSEMMCLMTGGMATIAGGVLAAYIGFLGGEDEVQKALFARHLLIASIISAPAAVAAAKILVPEKEKFNEKMELNREKMGTNALEAITNGTTDGLRLAINVGAMLLVFTALVYGANWVLGFVGRVPFAEEATSINEWIAMNTAYDKLSLQMIFGYVCAPIAWMIGVCSEDAVLVGQLLGEKTILNEFYAYVTLGDLKSKGVFTEEKSIIMATYVLCGFANIASIGIQIGGIGALVPSRKGLLSQLGVKALIGGTIACLYTATVVGMLL